MPEDDDRSRVLSYLGDWPRAPRCGKASSGSCAAEPERWSCSATRPGSSSLCTGGFPLDVPYTATALRELAKMDGAIVLTADTERIVRAGVQLMPDPAIETVETGTRHRTADRVARQTGVPVVSVSASMATISLYVDETRRVVEQSETILTKANQALQTLERYRARLWEVTARLSSLEVQDQVTVRDFAVSGPAAGDGAVGWTPK